MYYDVLVYQLCSNSSDKLYSYYSFKTYSNLKKELCYKICSNLNVVYIRKVQKGFHCSWRVIKNVSTEYYRLSVLHKDFQDVLNKNFALCISEVNNAAK